MAPPLSAPATTNGTSTPPPSGHGSRARQGVTYPVLDDLMVAEPASLAPVPADGTTMGEIFMRGNIVMKGYLKNSHATEEAFAGGWFHSGDLGVMHPDGYIELKDRSKDIIISGGENISTIEVEDVLYRHPSILDAAVVACPDPMWGETPLRLCDPEARGECHGGGDHRLLPRAPRSFQSAADRDVRAAAENLDRQDPEIPVARAYQGQRVRWCKARSLGGAQKKPGGTGRLPAF